MIIKYKIAKFVCKLLPPILAQRIRNAIISIEEGEQLKLDFKRKSFTGSLFSGNTSDFHAFKFSIHGYFDWRNIVIADEVLKYRKGGNIVEVGANIGTETISFCDIAKKYKSQVFAFEPLASNMENIIQNKTENDLNNLLLYNCLVSNKSGKAYFKVPEGNNSGSGFISNSSDKNDLQEYDVITLDEKILNHTISLICIDVEGFEYQVLQGSENLIRKNKPILILEVNKRYLEKRGQIGFKAFCDYLTALGYISYSIDKLGITKVDFNNHTVQANKNWICVEKKDSSLIKQINRRLFICAFNPFMKIT